MRELGLVALGHLGPTFPHSSCELYPPGCVHSEVQAGTRQRLLRETPWAKVSVMLCHSDSEFWLRASAFPVQQAAVTSETRP